MINLSSHFINSHRHEDLRIRKGRTERYVKLCVILIFPWWNLGITWAYPGYLNWPYNISFKLKCFHSIFSTFSRFKNISFIYELSSNMKLENCAIIPNKVPNVGNI